jgi:hypothetical protein
MFISVYAASIPITKALATANGSKHAVAHAEVMAIPFVEISAGGPVAEVSV